MPTLVSAVPRASDDFAGNETTRKLVASGRKTLTPIRPSNALSARARAFIFDDRDRGSDRRVDIEMRRIELTPLGRRFQRRDRPRAIAFVVAQYVGEDRGLVGRLT